MSADTMTREEWERRFADRIKEVSGLEEQQAVEVARIAAEQNLADNGDEWLDPEDDADVEMSYWDDDDEEGGDA